MAAIIKTNGMSFPCRECGGATDVKDTRPTKRGVRRRRVCRVDKNHKCTTIELPADEIEELAHLDKVYAQIRKMHEGLATLLATRGAALSLGVQELHDATRLRQGTEE